MGAHIVNGQFQSDKYPTCPPDKVPLSVKDPTAQDLLWKYAQRRRVVDAEFSDDLQTRLVAVGYKTENPAQEHERHVANLRAALAFFEEWAEVETYGGFPGGDPRLFTPDPDDATEQELAAHKAACEAWERGDRTEHGVPPVNEEEIRYTRKTGEEVVVEPGTAFVSGSKFGPGSYTMVNEEAVKMRDGLRALLADLPPDTGRGGDSQTECPEGFPSPGAGFCRGLGAPSDNGPGGGQ